MTRRSISRRAVLAAAATPALAGLPAGAPADSLAISRRWLAAEAEKRRLHLAWDAHESWLDRTYGWYRLSQREQRAIPEAQTLTDIDTRLTVLEEEGSAVLKTLLSTPATSILEVTANLIVAGRLLYPDDHPEAHKLIVRAVYDLKTLQGLAPKSPGDCRY